MTGICLLLDANISWRSINVLKKYFEECLHVDNIGIEVPATDTAIWEYAHIHNMVIVTNDEDFLNLLLLKGFPPKIVLLKTGNQSRQKTEETIIGAREQIIEFCNSTEHGLMEIVSRNEA